MNSILDGRGFFETSIPSSGHLDSEYFSPHFSLGASVEFDAIYQFRLDFLANFLVDQLNSVGLGTLRTYPPFDSVVLSRPLYLFGGKPKTFEVKITNPRLVTLMAEAPHDVESLGTGTNETLDPQFFGRVIWDVELNVIVLGGNSDSSVEGVILNRDVRDSPSAGNEREVLPSISVSSIAPHTLEGFRPDAPSGETILPSSFTIIPLATGTATISAHLLVTTRTNRYQTRALLEFNSGITSLASNGDLFQELVDGGLMEYVADAFESLSASPPVAITPVMSLNGSRRADGLAPDLGDFIVKPIVTTGVNFGSSGPVFSEELAGIDIVSGTNLHEVLSLCVIVGGEIERGDTAKIQSFLVDKNFGYYARENIVKAVLRLRWQSLTLPQSFETEVPVDIEDPDSDNSFVGRARIRFTVLDSIGGISLVASDPGLNDPVRVNGKQTIQLLNLWNDENTEIEDLQDLGEPVDVPLIWDIELIAPDTRTQTSVIEFYKTIASQLLEPLYRPMVEKLSIRSIDGITSSPAGVVVFRSNLG